MGPGVAPGFLRGKAGRIFHKGYHFIQVQRRIDEPAPIPHCFDIKILDVVIIQFLAVLPDKDQQIMKRPFIDRHVLRIERGQKAVGLAGAVPVVLLQLCGLVHKFVSQLKFPGCYLFCPRFGVQID